jgi:uncharacterized protein YbcI
MEIESARGSARDAIADAVVALFEEYLGRAPERARTFVQEDLVLVVLENTLTKGEQVLADDDRVGLVQEMRRTFIGTMRDRLREVVERETGRTVHAMLGDHSVLPDYAAAAFILESETGAEGQPEPTSNGETADGVRGQQSEISRGFTALYKDSVGRGPTDVRTYIADDMVTVLLTGTLTKVERTLAGNSRPISVEGMRREFQSAISERAKDLVETATGARVVAFMSDHSIEPDYAIEVLLLDSERWGESAAGDD